MVEQGTNGRPHSSNWRALHAEGILWDGQIFVAGAGVELPLRMIATSQRVAFAKGGAFVLDVPRDWLQPAPYLNPDGTIMLTIAANEGERPERLRVVVRDGRRLAVDLVAALSTAKPEIQSRSGTIYVPEPLEDVPPPPMARGRRSAQPPRSRERTGGEPIAALDSDDFPPLSDAPPRSKSMRFEEGLSPVPIEQTVASDVSSGSREVERALQPISSMSNRTSRHARRGWAIRLSGLVLLLTLAAGFGSGRIPQLPGREIASHLPNTSINAPFAEDDPTESAGADVAQEIEPTSTPTTGQPAQTPAGQTNSVANAQPTTPPSETAIVLGVGGMDEGTETAAARATPAPTRTAMPTATATNEPAVKAADNPEPTATATGEPVDVVVDDPQPSATATDEPPVEPTSNATDVPTSISTPDPTATTEPAPSIEATIEPTVADTATSEPAPAISPSVAPTNSAVPTATMTATSEPTSTPTPTETPKFPAQEQSLGNSELPLQSFSDAGFRFTVEGVTRGATIDDVALTAVSGADWVLVLVNAENWSDGDQSLAIADFELLTYGEYGVAGATPDPVTGTIAKTLALNPALGSTDSALFSPDDAHRLALVYLIRPDTTLLQLTIGDNTIDLTPSLGQPINTQNLGAPPVRPELLPVTVSKILDGQSILVVAENGGRSKVLYLGVAAPLGDSCYASESKAANAALVEGQTVYLERENDNRVPGSRIVRDVWIESADGGLTLVSAELAAVGAVVAAPVEPDIRFSGWIQAGADGAQANNLGLWAACGGLQTPTPEATLEVDAVGSPIAGVTVESATTEGVQAVAPVTEALVQPARVATEAPLQQTTENPQIIEQARLTERLVI